MKQFKMKQKNKKIGFFSMLLGTFGASLLANMLAGKGIDRAGEGYIRAFRISNAASSFN